jgi:hypothetical protein
MLPALMKKESPAFKVVVGLPFFVEGQNAFLHISRDRPRMGTSALSASGRNLNCYHANFIAWYGEILCEQYLTLELLCVGGN